MFFNYIIYITYKKVFNLLFNISSFFLVFFMCVFLYYIWLLFQKVNHFHNERKCNDIYIAGSIWNEQKKRKRHLFVAQSVLVYISFILSRFSLSILDIRYAIEICKNYLFIN